MGCWRNVRRDTVNTPLRSDPGCSQQGPQAGCAMACDRPQGSLQALTLIPEPAPPSPCLVFFSFNFQPCPPSRTRMMCVCECFNFYSWQKLRHKMDLEGDETSRAICWAAAASFLEWEGLMGGRAEGGPKPLRWGWELSPPQ